MSVNYYARTPTTPTGDEGLHIGQHAGRIEFLFRAHRDRGLTTVAEWSAYLQREEVTIVAESGYEVAFDEFWPKATARPADVGYPMSSRWEPTWATPTDERQWRDEGGHPFVNYEFC